MARCAACGLKRGFGCGGGTVAEEGGWRYFGDIAAARYGLVDGLCMYTSGKLKLHQTVWIGGWILWVNAVSARNATRGQRAQLQPRSC